MSLQPTVGNKLAGLWLIDGGAIAIGPCYALEILADSDRGQGYFVNLVHWNRGRLGCETCSSSFTRFELTEGHPAGPNSVLFTGEIPRNASDTRLDVQLTVSLDGGNLAFDDTHARWAPGVLTMSGASQDVVFRSVEFLPPFDPDRG